MKRLIMLLLTLNCTVAAIPQQINYQGQLARPDGTPLDTTVAMTFKLYTDSTAGSLLWTESWPSIGVVTGVFSARLGQITPLTDAILNQTQIWLGTAVGADTEMAPRSRFVSVAYAYRVGTVDGATGGAISGNVSIGGTNTISGGINSVAIGQSNTLPITGISSVAIGQNNSATNTNTSVTGGHDNLASGAYSHVGGGSFNFARGASSVIGGGGGLVATDSNSATGQWSTISGGVHNRASGFWTSIGGGFTNSSTADFGTVAGGSTNSVSSNGSFIGAGFVNSVTGPASVVGGGRQNVNASQSAVIAGGDSNTVNSSAFNAAIGGGGKNTASGDYSTISGGRHNAVRGDYSTVGGGGGALVSDSNSAGSDFCTIGGGRSNSATGLSSTIGGGWFNRATNGESTVAGGFANNAIGDVTTVGGGALNTASGAKSTVSGGSDNSANGTNSVVSGGSFNHARGEYSVVGGGGGLTAPDSNSARGEASVIPGGRKNETNGRFSLAAGYRAKALHNGSFVWADSNAADFASTNPNQFLVRAQGGVGIGLNNPTEQLEVAGDLKADTIRVDAAIRFADGTIQTTSPASPGTFQQDSDTNSFDATRTWVQSMGYLKGANNFVSSTGNVSGGVYNMARGNYAAIAGGGSGLEADSNSATGNSTFIGGGRGNVASGTVSTVGGGEDNISSASRSVVAGGIRNTASNIQAAVGGGEDNLASGSHATIGGGENNAVSGPHSTIGGGQNNSASDTTSVVSGGQNNQATGYASAIAGGGFNEALGSYSTVGGGVENNAGGLNSTIPGGYQNIANGNYSFAAGRSARSANTGSFVWGSSNIGDTTRSPLDYSVTFRCQGGARFYTAASGTTTGVGLAPGGGAWANLCDKNQKRFHGNVNTCEVLQKITTLPLHLWSYKTQVASIKHIGPTAQDFYAAFGLGDEETSITTVDPDGVLLAAVQELAKQNAELRRMVQALMAEQQQSEVKK